VFSNRWQPTSACYSKRHQDHDLTTQNNSSVMNSKINNALTDFSRPKLAEKGGQPVGLELVN